MATIDYIIQRIDAKKHDYVTYDFSQTENNALTTFFDLAQEFEDIDDFYFLCVYIPKVYFNLDARLYLVEPKLQEMVLIAKTEDDGYELHKPPPGHILPSKSPYYAHTSLVLTIRGNKFLIDQLPFKIEDNVLGLLEVYHAKDFGPHQELFFEKYANRIGFNIHNRLLFEKNIEHLKFIRSLVADIEHNIIAPNMIYKLFLKHLRKKIQKNTELETLLSNNLENNTTEQISTEYILTELTETNRGLTEELENIEKHHKHMSLFLETLLRRSHFDKGRLTLLKKQCNMNKDVIQPQLERFFEKFKKMGISIDDQVSGIPDAEIISVVDIGLLSQVYANLFSNSLKYTQEIITLTGEKKKTISYGREIIKDYFGPRKDGFKYNVFSTGAHINPEEREKIFEDGYRGTNVLTSPGTGHGLTFIKNAIEMHGGTFGYETTQYGNNFYFIIPG
jgi:signal transduction histidine kinase